MAATYCPIKSIQEWDEETETVAGSAITDIMTPSSYQLEVEDVSSKSAGRTEDGVMHKEMIGQAVSVKLTWNYITIAEAAKLMQDFNHEYLEVEYLDMQKGKAEDNYFRTAVFYVGNRSVPVYNTTMGIVQKLSFNLVEKGVDLE